MGTSLETLLVNQRWDEVRRELKRYKPNSTSQDLFMARRSFIGLLCCAEDVPGDILEILASKLLLLMEKGDTSRKMCDLGLFREGHLWSLDYLERFLKTIVRVTEMPISDPMESIVSLAELFPHSVFEESMCQLSSIEDLRSNIELHRLYDLWQRIEIIMRACIPEGFEKDMGELPFLCRMIEIKIPELLIWLALKLYPQQVSNQDKKGRLPLHWAALVNNDETEYSLSLMIGEEKIEYNFSTTALPDKIKAEVSGLSLIDILMKAYPEGASHADTEGSYPLDILLDNEFRCWNLHDWTQRNVMTLARYAPQALTRPSKLNQLLPFMAANCCHHSHKYAGPNEDCQEERQEMALRKLNMTFALLMQNPNVVVSGITSSEREIWLTDKLDKAQLHIQALEAENAKLKAENANLRNLPLPLEKSGPSFPLYQVGGQPLSAAMPPRKRKRTREDRKASEMEHDGE